jgi:hypothetical protein
MVARWLKIVDERSIDRNKHPDMVDSCSKKRKVRSKTMKRTKILFLLFIFALSIFQQRQEVNAQNLPSADNSSSNHSPQASGLASTVIVYMRHINNDGVIVGTGTSSYCAYKDGEDTGCVEQGSGLIYPPVNQYITFFVECQEGHPNDPNYCSNNPIKVDIENYYLKNVLPREINVAENDPPLAALKAQALAARSIADWKAKQYWGYDEFNSIDNSTDFQVFKPGSFEAYHVADEAKANEIKNRITQAIQETSGEYLYYADVHNKLSLDAEFGSDVVGHTEPEGTKYYLIRVEDPISTTCDVPPTPIYSGWGMSQKGAIRWSLGNQCAAGGDDSTKWSVAWDGDNGYKQILAHYYTGIDILDGGGNPVAPDDRWNLLWHNNFLTFPQSYCFA